MRIRNLHNALAVARTFSRVCYSRTFAVYEVSDRKGFLGFGVQSHPNTRHVGPVVAGGECHVPVRVFRRGKEVQFV